MIIIKLWDLSFKVRLIFPRIFELSLLCLHLLFHLMLHLLLGPLLLFFFPFGILFPFSFLKLIWIGIAFALDFHWDLLKLHIVLSFSLLELLKLLIPSHLFFDTFSLSIPKLFASLSWITLNLFLKIWFSCWKTSLFITRESGLVIEWTTRTIKSCTWEISSIWMLVVSLKNFLIKLWVHRCLHRFKGTKWTWDVMFSLVNHRRFELI